MTHINKTAIFALIIPLMLVLLACGATSQIPAGHEYEARAVVPTVADIVRMRVTAETLNIRTAPSWHAPALYKGLVQGEIVTVYLNCNKGETQWLAINESCTRWVSGNYLTMEER